MSAMVTNVITIINAWLSKCMTLKNNRPIAISSKGLHEKHMGHLHSSPPLSLLRANLFLYLSSLLNTLPAHF